VVPFVALQQEGEVRFIAGARLPDLHGDPA
jgi:hypothetical protein